MGARDYHLAQLLCCLFFIEACFQFEFRAERISEKINVAADTLSRNQLSFFSVFHRSASSQQRFHLLLLNHSLPYVDIQLLEPIVQDLFVKGLAGSTVNTCQPKDHTSHSASSSPLSLYQSQRSKCASFQLSLVAEGSVLNWCQFT